MLSNIGNFLIVATIFISMYIIYLTITSIINNYSLKNFILFNLLACQTTFIIICLITLISGFIISDFSLVTVYQNSHTSKPLFYKIAGAWGNHEGSLLLWINVLVIFSFLFFIFNYKINKKYLMYTIAIQNILTTGFLFFLFFNSNPFSKLIPTPTEGLGLNPILQVPALAIHPPLLYVGFVGSSIYFSAALASLLSNLKGQLFARSIKLWVLISWSFQTLGIIVGSIWAYYELGWGGFWFWDPVENASLMPWFVMTALMHSTVVLQKRNTLYPWVIILCLLTFTLSVTGTFLVRSGILNSVHTFANDPSRGLYILIFLSLMIFSALLIFFKKNIKEEYFFKINSKETFILANNWFMAFFLITVLIGTTYPIFTEVISGLKISVGPPFYNIVIIPFVIPLLILMAIAPKAKWVKNHFKKSFLLLGVIASSFIINILIIYLFKVQSILINLIIISAIFLIIYSIIDFFKDLNTKISLSMPRIISNLGFGLLVLFIGLNHNFSFDKDFNIKEGEMKKFESFDINFKSLEFEKNKNYNSVIGIFNIKNLKNNSN